MMATLHSNLLTSLTMIDIRHAELLIYEPFDYQPHNDEVMGQPGRSLRREMG